jgi:hypothetical protein
MSANPLLGIAVFLFIITGTRLPSYSLDFMLSYNYHHIFIILLASLSAGARPSHFYFFNENLNIPYN